MQKEILFGDLNVGSEMPKLVKAPVDLIQLVKYAGASGDFNPLHLDPEVTAPQLSNIKEVADGLGW